MIVINLLSQIMHY